jgi:FdhE protein
MPYVTVPIPSPEELRAAAERRWSTVVANRPEISPAVDLQRVLLSMVIELVTTIAERPMPRLSLPPKYLAAKLSSGVPALAGEPIPLPVHALTRALIRMSDALAAGGAGEMAGRIRGAIEDGRLDAGALLTAALARDQTAIRGGALHLELSPDLVWLVSELAVGPVAHALQRTLFANRPSPELDAALGSWNRGYCAACGSWPALAESVGGQRVLRCSFCSSAWELTSYACVHCNESGQPFVTAAPDQERKDRRLEMCRSCGSYLKTLDVPELSPFPLLAITDLETMDLDTAAMEHGYSRPPLKDFKKPKVKG